MSTAQISTVIQPIAPRGEFRNEPFIDFHDSENVHAMQAALTRVGDMLGHEYELVIGGERSRTASKIESLNPARPAQVVGVHQKAGLEHAERAMRAALEAFAGEGAAWATAERGTAATHIARSGPIASLSADSLSVKFALCISILSRDFASLSCENLLGLDAPKQRQRAS